MGIDSSVKRRGKASCECHVGSQRLRVQAWARGVFNAPTPRLEPLAVSNERRFSTVRFARLEEFQRESPSSYSEGKKKLPSRSGIRGYFMQMSLTEVTKGKLARL